MKKVLFFCLFVVLLAGAVSPGSAEVQISTSGKPVFSLFKDLVPGTGGSYPSGVISVGAKIFFLASDDSHGREL